MEQQENGTKHTCRDEIGMLLIFGPLVLGLMVALLVAGLYGFAWFFEFTKNFKGF